MFLRIALMLKGNFVVEKIVLGVCFSVGVKSVKIWRKEGRK